MIRFRSGQNGFPGKLDRSCFTYVDRCSHHPLCATCVALAPFPGEKNVAFVQK